MASSDQQREIALRIGLAARTLPDTTPARLIHVLKECLQLPLTLGKLEKLTSGKLKSAADGEFAEVESQLLEAALEQLKQPTDASTLEPDLPKVEPYEEGEIPGSIRIAIASNDGVRVDGHFGSCRRFMIYQISSEESRLIDIRPVKMSEEKAAEDKNSFRTSLIADCHVLYVCSVGGPAAAKVVKKGLHPIKLPNSDAIEELLERLSLVLAGSPPPWLAKVMGHAAEERVRFELEESE